MQSVTHCHTGFSLTRCITHECVESSHAKCDTLLHLFLSDLLQHTWVCSSQLYRAWWSITGPLVLSFRYGVNCYISSVHIQDGGQACQNKFLWSVHIQDDGQTCQNKFLSSVHIQEVGQTCWNKKSKNHLYIHRMVDRHVRNNFFHLYTYRMVNRRVRIQTFQLDILVRAFCIGTRCIQSSAFKKRRQFF